MTADFRHTVARLGQRIDELGDAVVRDREDITGWKVREGDLEAGPDPAPESALGGRELRRQSQPQVGEAMIEAAQLDSDTGAAQVSRCLPVTGHRTDRHRLARIQARCCGFSGLE